MRALLLAGADKVSFNSAAVADRTVVTEAAQRFGAQCIVVAIDAKTVEPGRWEIFTHGGRTPTGIDAVEFALDMERRGLRDEALVDLEGRREAAGRVADGFLAVAHDIPEGCAATYFPEANVLVPLGARAERSHTPASKLVVVSIRPTSP